MAGRLEPYPCGIWMPRCSSVRHPGIFFLQANAMIGRCFVSVSICFKECAGGTAMSKVVVFALAILEAGGTYVPCDERLPWPRVSYMLTMSSAKLLIAGGEVESS